MNTPLLAAFHATLAAGEFDAALSWLQTNPWGDGDDFLEAVDQVADVFVSVDPLTAASLFARRLEKTVDDGQALQVRIALIDAYCRAQRLDAARSVLEEVRPDIDEVNDDELRHTYLSNIASFFQRAGDLAVARDLLEGVLSERRRREAGGDNPGSDRLTATVTVNLATVEAHPASGRLDRALDLLDQAEGLTTEATTLGNIAYNRGIVYVQGQDIAAATVAYSQAITHFESADSHPVDIAYVLRGQAALLARVGRVTEAITYYGRAVELFLDAAAFDEAARTDIGLLMAQAVAGHDLDAVRLDQTRRRLVEAAPGDLPDLLMNIANIEAATQRPEDAYMTLAQARRLFARAGRRVDVARADLSRAAILRRLGKIQMALRLARKSRAVFVAEDRTQLVAHADHNIALAQLDLGDTASATESILSALAELDRRRHDLPSAHDRVTIGSVTYPHLFDVALDVTDQQPELQAAIIERARVQPVPTPGAQGHLRFAPPPPVAAHPGARVVPGIGPTRLLVEQTSTSLNTHRVGWALTRGRLMRSHVTSDLATVDHVPVDAALFEALRMAVAQPTAIESQSSHDTDAVQRASLYRAARGPLLSDPELADRLAPTVPRSLRTLVDSIHHQSAFDLLRRLGEQLISRSLRDQLENGNPRIRLAPSPLLGYVPWAAIRSTAAALPN